MRNRKYWTLLALLVGACAIPDVQIDDSLGSSAGTSASSDDGGSSNQGGKSSGPGKAGDTATGAESSAAGDTTSGNPGGSPGEVGGTTGSGGKATAGSSGKATGGSTGSGGSRPSGGSTGTGGTGGAVGGDGSAVGKFCNSITNSQGAPILLRLQVGYGANQVTFETASGTCAPVVNKACVSIPLGTVVPVALIDPSNPSPPLKTTTVTIVAGNTWIFWAGFDTAPYLDTDNTYTAAECKADDFATIASGF